MNWNGLEAFASLSETLSFTQTALQLGVTQPNISKAISNLEAELDVSLFNRNRKKVALTQAGVELRRVFVARHGELKEAIEQFRSREKGLRGVIRLGCLPEIGINLVFPHVLRFQNQNPGVQVQVFYASESVILEKINLGKLDFGICSSGEDSGLFRAFPLLTETIQIYGSPSMIPRLASHEWTTAPWVHSLELDPLTSGFLKKFAKSLPFKNVNTQLVVNSHRSMAEALISGTGFAVMPEASVASYLTSGQLVALPGFRRMDHLYLVMPDLPRTSDRNTAFRKHLFGLRRVRKTE